MSPIKEDAADALDTLLEKAQDYLKQGYLREAQESFSQVLERSPELVSALVCRGIASIKLKEPAKAEVDFLKAKTLDASDEEAWLGLGMSLAMQEKIYPALDVLEGMLALHPNFVRGRIQTAKLYYQLCLITKGKPHLDAALNAKPSPEERKAIVAIQESEAKLDKKRIFRPDFVALNPRKKPA
jgi:tetratricopeptide (TPR) repeat protein